jgi:hypothetical protein
LVEQAVEAAGVLAQAERGDGTETIQIPAKREVSDVRTMPKDTKARFDPTLYPKLMRK